MSQQFKTSNLTLAATLHALGKFVDNIDKTNPEKAFFIFQDSEEVQNIIHLFNTKKALVEPSCFHYAIRNLKNKIFANK